MSALAEASSQPGTGPEEEAPTVDEDRLHLYRSLWIAIQDVEMAKADSDRSDYQYKGCKSQVDTFNRLCKRYSLQRFRKSKSLEPLTGTLLGNVLKHQWFRIRKEDGYRQVYFWRDGFSGCNTKKLREFESAYRVLSERYPDLPTYCSTAPTLAHGDTRESSSSLGCLIDNVPMSAADRVGNGDGSAGSISSSDDDVPLRSRSAKRPRIAAQFSDSETSTRRSAIVKLPLSSGFEQRCQSDVPPPTSGRNGDAGPISPKKLEPEDLASLWKSALKSQEHGISTFTSDYLRLPSERCSPVTPEPNEFLISLYRRCWGGDWRHTCDKLSTDGKRSVLNDFMALVSAFLFENVFTIELPPRPNMMSQVAIGSLGTLDHSSSIFVDAKYLESHVKNLTSDLFLILHQYLSALMHLSRMMYCTPFAADNGESAALSTLQASLSEVIKSALLLKRQIDESELQPTYTWPSNGDTYDSLRTYPGYSFIDKFPGESTVAYTTYPGVVVQYRDDDDRIQEDVAYKAQVILRHTKIS